MTKTMTNSEVYITAYMRKISSFTNRERLVLFFKKIVKCQDINRIVSNYCPRESVNCSGTCYECWQDYSNRVRRGGEPEL